ncbi:MAG: hypothetical protein KDN22_16150 [Verrucomicrobiae bacterium]|nr:hypothetical protein [Verrucomicrobiae bacterium]
MRENQWQPILWFTLMGVALGFTAGITLKWGASGRSPTGGKGNRPGAADIAVDRQPFPATHAWEPPAHLSGLAASPRQQLAFFNAVDTLDSDGCAALFERYSGQMRLTGTAATNAFQRLFERWSVIDPKRAIAAITSLSTTWNMGGQPRLLDLAVTGWAKAAAQNSDVLDETLPLIQGVKDREVQSTFVRGLLTDVDAPTPTFRESVERARELLKKLPKSLADAANIHDDPTLVSAILDQWRESLKDGRSTTRDPMDVFRYAAEEITDPELRWGAQQLAVRQLAQVDPHLAAETLDSIGLPPSSRDKNELLGAVAIEWGNRDMPATVDWILEHSIDEQKGLLRAMLDFPNRYNSALEPQHLAKLAELVPLDRIPEGMASTIAAPWLSTDPEAAVDWFSKTPEANDPTKLTKMMTEFANYPSNAQWDRSMAALKAVVRLENLSVDDFATQLRIQMFDSAQGDNPAHAADLAAFRESLVGTKFEAAVDLASLNTLSLKDPVAMREALAENSTLSSEQRAEVLKNAAKAMWLHENVADTLKWMSSLTPDEAFLPTGEALFWSVRKTPDDGIPAATDWLNALPDEKLSDPQASRVANAAATALMQTNLDPRVAAEWANTALPESLRDAAVAEVMEGWASIDPASAAEWLITLPEKSRSDTAVGKLVDEIAWDPANAFSLAGMITSPEARIAKLGEIARNWSVYAPDELSATIETSNLTPQEAAAVLNIVDGKDK